MQDYLFNRRNSSQFFNRMCAMLLPELASFAAAMLFAVHPIHTEAVSIEILNISF